MICYLVLAALPFVVAAAHSWFWEHEHSTAPVAAAIWIALLVALLLRKRWAWWLLIVFQSAILISFVFDFTDIAALLLNIASFGVLLSGPMRRYVGVFEAPRARSEPEFRGP